MPGSSQPCVLVTGFTGFVGKVVVEELCRQSPHDLPKSRIIVLVRSSRGKTAQQRFDRLQDSICFTHLPAEWQDAVTVVDADLEKADLGMEPEVYAKLAGEVTHIIHCAASVEFDTPLQEAARSNIDTSLNVLAFAKTCQQLERMVSTSTAYVHARTVERIPEALAPLPAGWTPESLYQAIVDGKVKEAELLRISQHANTYTLTKCLAEHLLVLRHGEVPLSIVRPSIINVALQYPFPGFTDSYGALSGFGALFGTGFLHAMIGDWSTRFDIIPVDLVAQHLIDASGLARYGSLAESPASTITAEKALATVPITHCVSGLNRGGTFGLLNSIGLAYFTAHREQRRVHWKYTGPNSLAYHWHVITSQSIPVALACYWFAATRQHKQYKLARLLQRSVKKCNKVFPYFLSNTFDFVNSQQYPEGFELEPYLWLTASGIHRHLIKRELWQTKGPALTEKIEMKNEA